MAAAHPKTRAWRWGALLVLPLLSGCVAAAIPVIAAGGIATGKLGGDAEEPSEVVAPPESRIPALGPRPTPTPAAAPPQVVAVLTPVPTPTTAPPQVTAVLTPPPPSPGPQAMPTGAWSEFFDYALARRAALGGADPVSSAVLLDSSELDSPDLRPCRSVSPAVIIDLDADSTTFSPAGAAPPSPGIAEGLARLREAGFAVMWISQADANQVTRIGEALRSSGLDPTGRDPLLLPRSAADSKQSMRVEASESACVLAIAGDRRGDFDELFDYLIDPTRAVGLDAMLGAGWFLVPAPLTP